MIKSILILSVLMGLVACSSDDNNGAGVPPVIHSKPGQGTVKVVGDSLAFGEGSSNVSAKTPTNCLRSNFPGTFLNLAVNGATSEDLKNKLDFLVKGDNKMFFVSAGGNDVMHTLYGLDYPETKTLADMEVVFDRLLATNALVVYLALNPPAVPPYQQTERLPKITALARAKGVLTVDGMTGLWADPLYMSDEVHPNDAGYEKMCDVIVNSVTPHYP